MPIIGELQNSVRQGIRLAWNHHIFWVHVQNLTHVQEPYG